MITITVVNNIFIGLRKLILPLLYTSVSQQLYPRGTLNNTWTPLAEPLLRNAALHNKNRFNWRFFSLPVWLSRCHCCYGAEPHKRKQPCTEIADP
ncbi:hypothetical protein T07_9079 [Trichinella nelsoni]|uniref:Uncharacterized protein n=1 Tax=Trichinella nelsoni TaxID=6336 RepID=A0A0V0RTK1_9BILA|nr:hypothetical protein T07_9079 [Trichinella nelsoni]